MKHSLKEDVIIKIHYNVITHNTQHKILNTEVYTYNKILGTLNDLTAVTCNNTGESNRHCVRPESSEYTLCNSFI